MKIYGFHGNVSDLNVEDELRLTLLWRDRWEALGWEAIILNEWHARQHPLFTNLYAAVSHLPTSNPKDYELFCFLRWLALAWVGGGWMSDFDLMPRPAFGFGKGFEHGHSKQIHIFQTPCCPAFVYCPNDLAEKFCESIIAGRLGNEPQNGQAHYSDMYCLEALVAQKVDWIEVHDIVKLWSDKGWEEAPLVHFANAVMQPANKIPRWHHIPQLLK